jgi:Flp pilus assembly protein TadB
MIWAIMVGAGLGGSLWLLRIALAPPRVDLAVAVGRWETSRTRTSLYRPDEATTWRQQLGRRLSAELAARGVEMRKLRADLELVDKSLEQHLVTKLLTGLVGLLLPTIAVAALAAAGVGIPWTIPAGLGLALGVAFFFLPDMSVRREAADRRDELHRALGSYLDLVAMSMAGGRGVPEALPTAARIGRGWAFDLLADTISHARYAGITPWEALGDLGERTGMQELRDLGGALTLVADDGAKVRDSLTARASTMRRRQLAEAEGDAQQADQSMRMAQLILAFGFLVFIGYPAVVNVLVL